MSLASLIMDQGYQPFWCIENCPSASFGSAMSWQSTQSRQPGMADHPIWTLTLTFFFQLSQTNVFMLVSQTCVSMLDFIFIFCPYLLNTLLRASCARILVYFNCIPIFPLFVLTKWRYCLTSIEWRGTRVWNRSCSRIWLCLTLLPFCIE